MARRHTAEQREVLPDPKYGEVIVSRFINGLIRDGKKSVAERIFYGALDIIEQKEKTESSLGVFKTAVENVKPALEVKSRRVGGSTYQVPMELRPVRKQSLAIRWIIQSSLKRSGRSMREKLAGEILDAYFNRGTSIKKKEDTHKMAEANKAFAHFRW